MFNREAKLPIELEIPSKPEKYEHDIDVLNQEASLTLIENKVKKMVELRERVQNEVSQNIDKAQERRKKDYDKKLKFLRLKSVIKFCFEIRGTIAEKEGN